MARIRTIKPEFWTHEDIMECSMNARLLFIGMWNFADDAGRMKFSVKQIKAQILPGDDVSSENILGMIDELITNDLVICYRNENKEYLAIKGWHHQRIDKPRKSQIPSPGDEKSEVIRGTIQDHSAQDTIRYDTIGGKDTSPPTPQNTEPDAATEKQVVARFLELRDELFPQAMLPAPTSTLEAEAIGYLQSAPLKVVNEHIEKTIRQFAKDGKTAPNSLKFCRVSMQDAVAAHRKASTAQNDTSDFMMIDQQRQTLKAHLWGYVNEGFWSKDYGPRPGEEGCAYPADLIREMIGDDKAVQRKLEEVG